MSRSFHEENWDRQRAYLIRNLFHEDNQQLSTITEEEQSNDSIPDKVPATSVPVEKSEDQPESPYSSLPSLIIEKEPNKHDEPEEHYIELEKRIMKVYRKMFCKAPDADKDSDTDISDRSIPRSKYCERRASYGEANNEYEFIDEDNGINAKDLTEINTRTKDIEKTKIKSNEPDYHNDDSMTADTEISSSTEIFPKSTTDYDVDSDESIQETDTSKSVTGDVGLNADVHRSAPEEIVQKAASSTCSDETQQELEEHDVSASNVSSKNSVQDNSREMEVMRAARPYTDGVGSLHNTFADESSYSEIKEKSHLEPFVDEDKSSKPSDLNDEDYQESIDDDILLPTFIHNETASSKDTRKRKASASQSPSTKKLKKEVETQTDNERLLPHNLITRIYGIYRLCSCANHRCQS